MKQKPTGQPLRTGQDGRPRSRLRAPTGHSSLETPPWGAAQSIHKSQNSKLLKNWIQQSTGNGYVFLTIIFTEALDGLPFATARIGGCPSYRTELKAK